MSDVERETQQIIDRIRQQRAALGDTTKPYIKPVRYKRLSKSIMARIVTYGYVFTMGMLFSALLQGIQGVFIAFLFVAIALLYSIFRE